MDNDLKEIILYEIRQNRKEIQSLKDSVFENKMKLSFFITGATLFINLAFMVVKEKFKKLL